eukprot:763980-Hanusia_phi.AAC.4
MSGRGKGKDGARAGGKEEAARERLQNERQDKRRSAGKDKVGGRARDGSSGAAKSAAPKEVQRYQSTSTAPVKIEAKTREDGSSRETCEAQGQPALDHALMESEAVSTKCRKFGRDLLVEGGDQELPSRITIKLIALRCIGEERIAAMQADELAEAVGACLGGLAE